MLRKTWWLGLIAIGLAGAGGCERYHERWCEDHNYIHQQPYRGGGGCAPGCQPACVPTGAGFRQHLWLEMAAISDFQSIDLIP